MSTGRGYVESEEKRSYGSVFLFIIGLLVACTVWAIWQDSFSRHLWKKYKTDFYRGAITKFETEKAEDLAQLAETPEYVALQAQLAEAEASLESGEVAEKLAQLAEERIAKNVAFGEADLDLRIVKGEIEEGWYWLENATHHGHSGKEEHDELDRLHAKKEILDKVYEEKKQILADLDAEVAALRASVTDVQDQIRPFLKKQETLNLGLDGVSMELFGSRVPHIPTIDQVVLKGFDRNNFENWVDRVERCQNCHVAIDRPGFDDMENPHKTHPDRAYYLGNHEVRKFGCTPCHGGQGASINSIPQAHGKVDYWEDPLLDVNDKVQAKCATCHATVQGLEGAEVAARGEWLYQEMGCHGCHLMKRMENLEKVGPSLARVAAKTSPEWLVDWVENPQGFRPRTRMPNFVLERWEAEAMGAYLLSASLADSVEWLEGTAEPQGVDPKNTELVEQGRELTQSLGCLGCHGFAADEFAREVAIGKDYAPNLARIAEKTSSTWIYNWILEPRGYSEHARMPSLRLSDVEAQAITSYLLTLSTEEALPRNDELRSNLAQDATVANGERLVRKYGCPGCHVIPGMETESRVSVELSAFGDKHLEELFFGDELDIEHTWDDWTINKILNPRVYETERIEQNMPVFGFDRKDARALTVWLASRTDALIGEAFLPDADRELTIKRGRELVARYNCQGCHSFDGQEGAIRVHYEDNMENAPPILVGEGSKLQGDWFFDFLMKPIKLRPWLDVRMPSFNMPNEDATAIVEYFAALEGFDLAPVILEASEATDGEAPASHTQMGAAGFDCRSCHVADTRGPEDGKYAVSSKGLDDKQIAEWMRTHMAEEAASAEKAPSLRDYLGAGGG